MCPEQAVYPTPPPVTAFVSHFQKANIDPLVSQLVRVSSRVHLSGHSSSWSSLTTGHPPSALLMDVVSYIKNIYRKQSDLH